MSLFKIVRFVGLAVATLLLLFIIGAIALSLTISPDTIRAQVEKALSTNGRIVTIAGPVDVQIFPSIALSFEDFNMSQADAANIQKDVLTINKGTAHLQLLPLLTGTAEYDSIDMAGLTVHPDANAGNTITFTCNVTAQGQAHYDFAQYDAAIGFTPDAIKRAITSSTQVTMTDIRLLDKDLVSKLSQTFGGNYFEQFKSLSATINTNDGIVRSDDIKLVGTHVNATGNGTVNLITDALAASFDINIDGLDTIPVNIKGTTQTPIYTVDSGAAVNLLMKGLQGIGVKLPSDKTTEEKSSSGLGDIDSQKILEGLGNFLNKLGL